MLFSVRIMYLSFAPLIGCYIAITTISNNIKRTECSKDEQLLMKRLLEGYRTDVRPVANASLPVPIEIQLKLKQIVDLDVRNQILKTNLCLDYYWKDYSLFWNPVSTIQLNIEAKHNISNLR